jgi:hypothetical protein
MAEHVETEHAGVLRYVKCHTEYATDGQETLLPLCEGDIVAVVQEKEETGWCVSHRRPPRLKAYQVLRMPAHQASRVAWPRG